MDITSPISTYLTHRDNGGPMQPVHPSWPLALAPVVAALMLNCRNIVAEDVHSEKKHPMVKGERDHRPYCSYKVLKLEVPHQPTERNCESIGDGGPKMRFHECRGHFKNLQAARYKEARGWHWWPAHWRGSIELGRADKSYALAPAENPVTSP